MHLRAELIEVYSCLQKDETVRLRFQENYFMPLCRCHQAIVTRIGPNIQYNYLLAPNNTKKGGMY